VANKKRGTLEREMLASMREWTPERRRDFLTRADEVDRTLRYIERRDKAIDPIKVEPPFDLSAEVAGRLALEEYSIGTTYQVANVTPTGSTISTDPTADARREATQDLTSA
jgi:hypothetical protein